MRLVTPLRDDEDPDPRRVGSFTIEGLLGGGGCGIVYLGRAKDRRLVAIKVMSKKLDRDDQREEHRARFRREVEFVRSLSHRFVPRFLESGFYQGRPYLATHFVPGPTLHQLVRSHGPLPVDAVLGLGVELAEIVRAVHELGVHRDVKPGNVLITLEGPHLIDFGLAHLHNAVHITRQGTALGTREYMDPAGGPPADVKGLGGTLLFAATGHPPVEAASPGSADRLPDDRIDFSGVPDELRELLEMCLHPTRAHRPPALTVLELLRARWRAMPFVSALPVSVVRALEHAAAPFAPEPAAARFAPEPAPTPAAAAALSRSQPARPRPSRPARASSPGEWRCQLGDWVQAVVATPAPVGQVLVVTADGVITALAEGDGTQRWQQRLPAATTGALVVAGSRVYAGAEDGELHVLDTRDGRRLPRSRVGGRVSSCVVAGRHVVAVASDGTVAAFEAARGARAWEDTLPCALTGGLAVAGGIVYAGGGDGAAYAIDTARDGEITPLPSLGQRIHAVAVSGYGVHVAGADGGVASVSRGGHAPEWLLKPAHGQVWACRADPASALVATASVEGVLRVDDAVTGANHLERDDLGPIRRSLTLHGSRLLVGCVSGSLIELDVRNGAELRRQDGHSPIDAPAAITGSGVIVGGWLDGTVIGLPRIR